MKPHYRIVRFSPAPEFVEPVNVALLLVDEKARLVHDDRFAKLECVSGQADHDLLKFWLREVQEDLRRERPERAHLLLSQSNAQVMVSEPREVASAFSEDIERMLVNSYLRRHRKSTAVETHRHHIEGLLDHWLDKDLRIAAKGFIKRAAPKDFLSAEVKAHLKSNSFRVSRVYNGQRGLVLLDGLNLDATEETVRGRAQEIGYAYYAMESVRKVLHDREHKKLLKASVVFHPDLMKRNPKLDYAVASVTRDSDMIITDPTSASQRKDIEKKLIAMSEGELEVASS